MRHLSLESGASDIHVAMKRSLMMGYREFVDMEMMAYIIVTVSSENIIVKLDMIQEGVWAPSERTGWSLRLDPQRPEMKQQRHVHVARAKYINSKTNQFS
jgi:Family of unknown function (DUF6367)